MRPGSQRRGSGQPDPAAPSSRPADTALLRSVGFFALAASIVNLTIGGSIFVLPATLAQSMGPAAPLAFLLGAALFIPIVLCFAAAGSRITATGGPYSYVEAAFGRFPGFIIAAFFWISAVTGSGSMASALADQLAHLWPTLGSPWPRAMLLFCVYCALIALNARGVKMGSAANIVFAIAKVLPLVLLALFGFGLVRLANLRVETLPDWQSIGRALVIVVFAYSGIETALAPGGEVRDPSTVVPKAAMAGSAVVLALYFVLQLVAQGALGASLPGNDAPLAHIAGELIRGGGGLLVLTATLSLFGVLQGDLLGSSRLLYALARDRLLPASLAVVSARHRAPVRAVATHALIAWGLAAVGNFSTLALVAGGAFCIVYIGCCAAAWRLQVTQGGESATAMRLHGGPIIPLIGIIGLMLIMTTLSGSEWAAIGVTTLAASLWYAASGRGGSRDREN